MSHKGIIELEVKLNQRIDIEVSVEEVVEAMNELDPARRWNLFAQMLNGLSLSPLELNQMHLKTVIKYLDSKHQVLKMVYDDLQKIDKPETAAKR